MCSVPGYDASGHVEDLAAEQNTQITSIAIGNIFIYFVRPNVAEDRQVHIFKHGNVVLLGSAEGFNQADKAINTAVKSGRWVLLNGMICNLSILCLYDKRLLKH